MTQQKLAQGLKGLSLYERLDKSGISNAKFGLAVLAASLALHLALYLLDPDANSNLQLDSKDIQLIYLLFGFITALYALTPFVVLRYTQFNLESNLPAGEALDSARNALTPRRKTYVYILIVVAIIAAIMFNVVLIKMLGFHYFSPEMLENPTVMIAYYFSIPVQTFFAGLAFAAFEHVRRYLLAVAKTTFINLLELERYTCLSSPAVIFFCIISTAIASAGIAGLFVSDAVATSFGWVILAFGLMNLVLLVQICLPVWLVRNRIVNRILKERSLVQRALQGDNNALAASEIGNNPGTLSESELLTRLMFLNSLPEWPVGPHLQRIVIFGLLPPVAWVLAAIVENNLY